MSDTWNPSLSPKQMEFMRMCHRRPGAPTYILISGPRQSTKTTVALFCIAEHLWNVDNARFSVITPTVSVGDDSGVWTDLTEQVMPEWIAAGIGMEWITEPRQKGTTKKLYFTVTNKYGGKSTCQLDSLKYEEEAEERFKSRNHSGIYVSELSKYTKRSTFDTWRQSLRGKSYKEWELIFIGDTNPAPEGKSSWIWQIWYGERLQDSDDEGFKLWQEKLALMEFFVADNIFKDEAWHRSQAAMYAHSDDLLQRYYYGAWITATNNSIFSEVLKPNYHIVGDYETPANKDPEMILPDEKCSHLITGWDPGSSNSGFVIMEKIFRQVNGKEISTFNVIDEVVYIKSAKDMDYYVDECLERIAYWEDFLGHPVRWSNWSDRSAFDVRAGVGSVFYHQLVRFYSNGKIVLQAADRSPGTVRQRVDMTKKLFFEDRLFISRPKCPNLIEAFQGLGPGKAGYPLDKTSHFKHVFDAFSYAIHSECLDEVMRPRDDIRTGTKVGGLVSVPL